MALNRLRLHNILVQDMNAPSEAATEVAEVIDEGIQQSTDGLATRQDVEHAITREVNRLLRWLMAAGITIGGAIIALLIALIVRGG
jgi:hypothetical protein